MRDYMGPAVRQSPGSENWWIYWSHFRSYFYVYSYASGILVAKSLKGAANQDPAFIHRLKQFLAAGSSASPRELLERLDINISDSAFWDRGLDQFAAALKTAEKLAWRVSRH
jgi:oligoendopeptidase F